MNILKSLKYRIALTILVLEVLMLLVVLTETQSLSYELSKAEIDTQDQVILDTLTEASADALTLSNYSSLQPLFLKITESNHIKLVVLTDFRELVVASSDPSLFGSRYEFMPNDNEYLKSSIIEDDSELSVVFSAGNLQNIKNESISLGFKLGISGVIIIAIIGVLMGHYLTRRLNRVITHTKILADGDLGKEITISGNDEISSLAASLNSMSQQLKGSFKKIHYLAYHDSLTKLVNREEFTTRLSHLLESAKSTDDHHSLMFLDLDQFKIVNDTSGHEAGDELLIRLSNELSDILRDRDTLARLGGDEFGILLEHCPIKQGYDVAEKLRQRVESFEFNWKGKIFKVGVSIGLVSVSSISESVESAMSLADMACYEAKDAGGNAIIMADQKDGEILSRESDMRLVSQLNEAIDKDSWVLYFQQIHGLTEKKNLFFGEFLLRLEIGGKVLPPGPFIEAAERYQLMSKIDCQTVEKAFKQLESLQESDRPEISFINLSGQTIGNELFLNKVIKLSEDYNLPPQSICFEITETAAFNCEDMAKTFIQQLREIGFKFAIDDFGSGTAGFNYLKTMPVDILKIDGQYVVEMLNNKIDYQIVSSVNDTAHLAGVLTVAEFVENKETLETLKRLGLDFAQGYYLNKPEPLEHCLRSL